MIYISFHLGHFVYLCSENLYLGSYICSLDQTSNCPFYTLLYNGCHWVMEESIKRLLFFSLMSLQQQNFIIFTPVTLRSLNQYWQNIKSFWKTSLWWHSELNHFTSFIGTETKCIFLTSTYILISRKIVLLRLLCSRCNWLPEHTTWIHLHIWEQNLTIHKGNFIIRFTRLMFL